MGVDTVATKYSIGVDFGTLSGRAVLVDVTNGDEIAQSVYNYSHGVMDERLPDGTELPPDFALQDPADYIRTLKKTIPDVISQGGISPDDVIGIGIDFTACTILPIDAQGVPLCYRSRKLSPRSWAMALRRLASSCAAWCFHNFTQAWGLPASSER